MNRIHEANAKNGTYSDFAKNRLAELTKDLEDTKAKLAKFQAETDAWKQERDACVERLREARIKRIGTVSPVVLELIPRHQRLPEEQAAIDAAEQSGAERATQVRVDILKAETAPPPKQRSGASGPAGHKTARTTSARPSAAPQDVQSERCAFSCYLSALKAVLPHKEKDPYPATTAQAAQCVSSCSPAALERGCVSLEDQRAACDKDLGRVMLDWPPEVGFRICRRIEFALVRRCCSASLLTSKACEVTNQGPTSEDAFIRLPNTARQQLLKGGAGP
jgi:hypothetical protein